MRLIDADGLKDVIVQNVYPIVDAFNSHDYGMFWTGGIEKAIDEQPTVNQWTPCSERLPEYNETSEYLVTDRDGRVRHCCLDPYMPETFVTVEESMIVDAVAWRPAPEPWKGGENE